MLIKERLAIPNEKQESGTWHWLVPLSVFVLVCLALNDFVRFNFGLDVTQFLMELALVLSLVAIPATVLVGIIALVWRLLNHSAWQGALLASIALAPLVIFLVIAHLHMSYLLSPIKLNFRSAARFEHDAGVELTSLVKVRDKYLADSGYAKLGTWRSTDGDGDCVAFYLFVGTF
jgi:hypothetical protein